MLKVSRKQSNNLIKQRLSDGNVEKPQRKIDRPDHISYNLIGDAVEDSRKKLGRRQRFLLGCLRPHLLIIRDCWTN